MKNQIRIIIPTFNNPRDLEMCVKSIATTNILNSNGALTIVNNGSEPVREKYGHIKNVTVIDAGKNLGWEGGLDIAVKQSDEPFLVFQNDDTVIPISDAILYRLMHSRFSDDSVAAVGPSTTTAAGIQSVMSSNGAHGITEVNWLIFFTVMVRRSALEAVGGIDTSLPGGDDIDLSIRLNKAGHRVLYDPACFLIHEGFHTGNRVHGDGFKGVKGGWNSREMSERTNRALIQKHGFSRFFYSVSQQVLGPYHYGREQKDFEGDIIKEFITPEMAVLELGCGPKKTVPQALGVDRVGRGKNIPNLFGDVSVADIEADVTARLPESIKEHDVVLARHILEHCIDSVQTLRFWAEKVKDGGLLIVAVPDEKHVHGIPLNPEHCHAFTEESLRNLGESVGLKTKWSGYSQNGVSFVIVFEKPGVLMQSRRDEVEVVRA